MLQELPVNCSRVTQLRGWDSWEKLIDLSSSLDVILIEIKTV